MSSILHISSALHPPIITINILKINTKDIKIQSNHDIAQNWEIGTFLKGNLFLKKSFSYYHT